MWKTGSDPDWRDENTFWIESYPKSDIEIHDWMVFNKVKVYMSQVKAYMDVIWDIHIQYIEIYVALKEHE